MPMNSFAPYSRNPNCFIVMNVAESKKVIKIFNYPINYFCTRDLLRIPGISESSIRASLLKGEINHKIKANEIIVVCSDIDLLQFNAAQKAFLQSAGITNGLEVTSAIATIPFLFKQGVELIGLIDGTNRFFTIPSPDKFINGIFSGNKFEILVHHNGRELVKDIDYVVSESGGSGSGFDTITICSFVPRINSKLYADYVVKV